MVSSALRRLAVALVVAAAPPVWGPPALAQGGVVVMAGEVTDAGAILYARDAAPGGHFAVAPADTDEVRRVEARPVGDDRIARAVVTGLRPGTDYAYRYVARAAGSPVGHFRTLDPGGAGPVRFVVANCINQARQYGGRSDLWRSSWPAATGADSALGYPGLGAILARDPDVVVAAGDNVYYDYAAPGAEVATDRAGMRAVWDAQLSLPRFARLLAAAPFYWMKDDHDFRFNDADTTGAAPPSPALGIDVFREQVPVVTGPDDVTYRTHRLNRNVQVWMVEGRDYRSPNAMSDGPDKSIWGSAQADWLRATILASDAPVKVLIHPTPLVGPDGAGKGDNHTNPGGFQYERDSFFAWLRENGLEEDLIVVTGDRHWQYHSVHPAGVQEFSVGALNDANSRYGVRPGETGSTDPIGLVRQPYLQAPPSGGFLEVEVVGGGADSVEARFVFFDDEGRELYRHVERRAVPDAAPPGRFNLLPVWARLADDAGAFDREGGAGVAAVAMSGDGYLVATASEVGADGVGPAVTLWTTPRGAAIWRRPAAARSLEASGRFVVVHHLDGGVESLRVRDADDNVLPAPEPLADSDLPAPPSSTTRRSPDGALDAALAEGGVAVRDAGKTVATLADAAAPLAWTADGRFLVTGGAGGLRAYDREREFALSAVERAPTATALAVGPEGRLVSGHADGTVRLWEIAAEPATNPAAPPRGAP